MNCLLMNQDSEPIAVVVLADGKVERADDKKTKKEFSFTLSHPEYKRVYSFHSTTEAAMNSWMQAFQRATTLRVTCPCVHLHHS